jgi:hypothetical protein
MSFRLFIYYSAMAGGITAFLSWILGRLGDSFDPVGVAGIRGMWLGMLVSLALGLIDGLWTFGSRRLFGLLPGLAVAVLVGTVGGLVGGVIGQVLYDLFDQMKLPILSGVGWTLGWTITGLLVGVAVGVFDVLTRYVRQEEVRPARRKLINGVIGGTVGGVLGGFLSLMMRFLWAGLFRETSGELLWSPSSWGFIVLGICLGLMIGLAQVLLRESWLKVESGFRAGRELILTQPSITIGRAETCDIGLFGDPNVEKLHAQLFRQGDQYFVSDNNTPAGTFLNETRINGMTPLRSGDRIRVGQHVLLFGERQKRS